MYNKKSANIALKLTDGLFHGVTDTLLFTLFLTLASVGKSKTSIGAHQMLEEAQRLLDDINYDTIKRAFCQLKIRLVLRDIYRSCAMIRNFRFNFCQTIGLASRLTNFTERYISRSFYIPIAIAYLI